MQDRLRELQGGASSVDAAEIDLEMNSLTKDKGPGSAEFMDDFYAEVGAIKNTMTNIRRSIKQVEEKYVASLNSISIEQGHKAGSDVQAQIDSTTKDITLVKTSLETMKRSNQAFAADKNASQTEVRIRANMQGTLSQKFLELVQEFQEVQTNYKNKYKEKVERQYKIAKPDATQEEIDDVMTSGDSSKIFANQILDSHLHQQAKNALAYVEARHKDIMRLEVSINELHQLFVDMAAMVESQGEMLNQIEYNVNQSVAYTAQGVVELQGAVKQQKKSRKLMLIIICILIIIIIVVLAPTLGTLLTKKATNA